MLKALFIANKEWLTKDSEYKPEGIISSLPKWFRQADRFERDPRTNKYLLDKDNGRIPTWKACPPLFDIMTAGYVLKTPCDITFFIDENGINCKVENERYGKFVLKRNKLEQFVSPQGYYEEHFIWFPDWALSLPEGYSALYAQPFNRFDLPFMSVSGIMDNDKINLPGTMPFFVQKDFVGTIPAGTPYLQIIPFKRDDWESDYEIPDNIRQRNVEGVSKVRVPNGGVYKNEIWSRRKYE